MADTCDARAVGNATGCRWNINVSAGHLGAINVAYPERPLLGLSWRCRAKNVVLTMYLSSRSSEKTKLASLDDRALKGFPGPVEITLYSLCMHFLRRVHVYTYYNMGLTTVYFHIFSITRVRKRRGSYDERKFNVSSIYSDTNSWKCVRISAKVYIIIILTHWNASICYNPKSVIDAFVIAVWNLIL